MVTMHNLHRYAEFLAEIREAIAKGTFQSFREAFHADYRKEPGHGD